MTEFGINRTITRELAPEPFKPLSPSLYKEAVNKLLESNGKLGFVVMDGFTTLFGTLSNTHEVEVLFEFEREQQIGGLSALDLELGYGLLKSHEDYYKKTSELATQYYIDPTTEQPNIGGLVLAGTCTYKVLLCKHHMFDPRLREKIVNAVDVSCGGEEGFNEVIREIRSFQL